MVNKDTSNVNGHFALVCKSNKKKPGNRFEQSQVWSTSELNFIDMLNSAFTNVFNPFIIEVKVVNENLKWELI